ncbi:8386_t:CDS:2 [Gigaspora rosea]|nr:8386_t:CDS:2 [Gigaspora rosea]
MWMPCDTSFKAIKLEKIYMVNDHYEIEAEKRFLTATTDHITKDNGWYEEEEFEVYLAITPNEIDPHEVGQGSVTRRPILDEEFTRRIEYQDLIMDIQEEGTVYSIKAASSPEYEKVPEDLKEK